MEDWEEKREERQQLGGVQPFSAPHKLEGVRQDYR